MSGRFVAIGWEHLAERDDHLSVFRAVFGGPSQVLLGPQWAAL